MANNLNVILAVYGTPGFPSEGDILTKQAAEQIAAQMQGKIIDGVSVDGSEGKRFRIVSTSLEGDAKAGQVLAECEAVTSEEES